MSGDSSLARLHYWTMAGLSEVLHVTKYVVSHLPDPPRSF